MTSCSLHPPQVKDVWLQQGTDNRGEAQSKRDQHEVVERRTLAEGHCVAEGWLGSFEILLSFLLVCTKLSCLYVLYALGV